MQVEPCAGIFFSSLFTVSSLRLIQQSHPATSFAIASPLTTRASTPPLLPTSRRSTHTRHTLDHEHTQRFACPAGRHHRPCSDPVSLFCSRFCYCVAGAPASAGLATPLSPVVHVTDSLFLLLGSSTSFRMFSQLSESTTPLIFLRSPSSAVSLAARVPC